MVAKKIRTEYMKKFKDPKWETYSKCYEDMLRYRTTRRLLEHAHNPWFWEGWESGSESSGSTSPQNQNKVEPLKLSGESPKEEAGERPGPAAESEEAAEPRLDAEVSAGTDGAAPAPQRRASRTSTLTGSPSGPVEPEQSGAAPSTSRPPRKAAKGKSQPRESAESEKENKHPFALYGWAEKQAETGLKKTHNVRPAASTKEIHASALRAKTRREIEKRVKTLERRRVRSAEPENGPKAKQPPADNPWMTEYMRCFSARSR
ncbi:CCSAP protein, partial [Amia calva]|nr:CCSAP protein [Amia calva]